MSQNRNNGKGPQNLTVWFTGLFLLVVVLVAIGFSLAAKYPLVSVKTLYMTDEDTVVVVPLKPKRDAELRKMVSDARIDKEAAQRLLKALELNENYVVLLKYRDKLYRGRCPKGPALIYTIDDEANGAFAFVTIDGPMEVRLDESPNQIDLDRF